MRAPGGTCARAGACVGACAHPPHPCRAARAVPHLLGQQVGLAQPLLRAQGPQALLQLGPQAPLGAAHSRCRHVNQGLVVRRPEGRAASGSGSHATPSATPPPTSVRAAPLTPRWSRGGPPLHRARSDRAVFRVEDVALSPPVKALLLQKPWQHRVFCSCVAFDLDWERRWQLQGSPGVQGTPPTLTPRHPRKMKVCNDGKFRGN